MKRGSKKSSMINSERRKGSSSEDDEVRGKAYNAHAISEKVERISHKKHYGKSIDGHKRLTLVPVLEQRKTIVAPYWEQNSRNPGGSGSQKQLPRRPTADVSALAVARATGAAADEQLGGASRGQSQR